MNICSVNSPLGYIIYVNIFYMTYDQIFSC